MSRQCARPVCSGLATATLAYDYKGRFVWIRALDDERHPTTHDLCTRHADGLSVPTGWAFEDRRVGEPILRHARAG